MTDPVGLFEQEVEPKKFFIDVDVQGQSYLQESGKHDGLAQARVQLHLSDRKHIYNRQKYSLFMLLSDFGGFQGAVIMIPYNIMSFYAASMLAKSLTSQLPVISTSSHKKK